MVIRKNNQVAGIGVQKIIGKRFIQFDQPFVPTLLMIHCTAGGILHRKVHQTGQAAMVAISVLLAFLPIRNNGWIHAPLLTHNVEIGIFLQHPGRPVGHHMLVGIGPGILPDAFQANVFNPPNTVLDEVGRHKRVFLVQIGHSWNKPTVHHCFPVGFRSIRILMNCTPVAGDFVIRIMIDPVAHWHVIHPPVF